MNHINEMRNKKKYLSLKNNMNIFNITILSFFLFKRKCKNLQRNYNRRYNHFMKIIGNVNVLIKLKLHLSLLNKLHSSIDNIFT